MKCWPVCYLTCIKTENWKALANRSFLVFFNNRNAAFISFPLKGSFIENSLGLIGTAPAILCRLFLLINSVVFEQICGAATAGHHSGAYCSTSLEIFCTRWSGMHLLLVLHGRPPPATTAVQPSLCMYFYRLLFTSDNRLSTCQKKVNNASKKTDISFLNMLQDKHVVHKKGILIWRFNLRWTLKRTVIIINSAVVNKDIWKSKPGKYTAPWDPYFLHFEIRPESIQSLAGHCCRRKKLYWRWCAELKIVHGWTNSMRSGKQERMA